MIKILVRLALSACLCVMVYRETGPWACGAVALMVITFEIIALTFNRVHRCVNGLIRAFEQEIKLKKGARHEGPENRNAETQEGEQQDAQDV